MTDRTAHERALEAAHDSRRINSTTEAIVDAYLRAMAEDPDNPHKLMPREATDKMVDAMMRAPSGDGFYGRWRRAWDAHQSQETHDTEGLNEIES